MRKYILLFAVLLNTVLFAQNPEIKSDLPTIIPPSPTVAALMKFEEVPVSNYTGLPDVSIPLISCPTLSKDIIINVELKYHPNGIKADETASDVGLGWSLFAGGTISRTVRGLPDEVLEYPTSLSNLGRIGIFHKNNPSFDNLYYYFNDNLTNTDKDFYVPNPVSTQIYDKVNDFIWGASDIGRYDTEHDLWQFNFMGKSGRFYIKFNSITNSLEVIPLDEYRVKINYNYIVNSTDNNPYKSLSFEIFDEQGYKYIFDIIEKSYYKSATEDSWGTYITQSASFEKSNDTSFHLSKVFDNNNKLLVEFIYSNEGQYAECKVINELTYNEFATPNINQINEKFNCNSELKPIKSSRNNTFINKVRKVKKINISNYGSIKFKYEHERVDSNIALSNLAVALSEVTFINKDSIIVNNFKLEYDYSNVINKRMLLKKIIEKLEDKYIFEYYNQSHDGYFVGKDYWGYFNLIPSCATNNQNRKYPTPEFSTKDLLRKIKYATKGCTIFDFESNTYSYQGNQIITNYFEDDQNINFDSSSTMTFNNSNNNNTIELGTLNQYKKIIFRPSIVIGDISNASKTFSLLKKVNNVWVNAGLGLHCFDNSCCIEFYPEPNVIYGIKYSNFNINYNGTEFISLDYYKASSQVKQYLYGGGNRIKSINYFDQDTSLQYFDYPAGTFNQVPIKKKTFSYQDAENFLKSSGSLVYVKPLYKAEKKFNIKTQCSCLNPFMDAEIWYTSNVSKNVYTELHTQGSDVGYKNVTVTENGSISYTYTSPIEFPEEIITGPFNHIPSKNIDYKRGLLTSEIIKDNNGKLLTIVQSSYDFIDKLEQTGLRFFKSFYDSNYQGKPYFTNFSFLKDSFINNIDIIGSSNTIDLYGGAVPCWFTKSKINFHNADAISQRNIFMRPILEAYGWAKLASKTTQSYFYPNGGNTPNIVTSNETFTYNPINKQIATHTVSNSVNETLTTNYFYHTGNSPFSQNRISEIERIETKRGSELLSESKINYSNTFAGNQSFLPSTIEVKKGSSPSEIRLKNNVYDEFGHVLEVQQESGMKISYIYGYNNTQPVAKIENIAYANIPINLITAIQNASNGTDEQTLKNALAALRTAPALATAMITTLTYKPLIGVSTVTDPKGDTQTYQYDNFNRLQFVKDSSGNILSENEYHYKN